MIFGWKMPPMPFLPHTKSLHILHFHPTMSSSITESCAMIRFFSQGVSFVFQTANNYLCIQMIRN
ncbi:hypothetical protein KsCSTR_14310 [Candidatus Kuenenia stuttgartiensis]|uniref:Uncharacterized protein n=1 Tax=Kuenenia stuttgartiensis TaxID=174633 RepID=Q1Q1A5_KUEST|nr:hypothetical protein KsCSTR_14310 [Candidatus Kuenenia stuttgartiensis]CAJ73781.1 unknown protein [Candidatus Kuenenia stuttgartiensis]